MKRHVYIVFVFFLLACGSSSSSSSPDAQSASQDPEGGVAHKDGGNPHKDGGGTQSEGGGAKNDGGGPIGEAGLASEAGTVGTATLTWDAPTTYSNGTPLTVAGYHVYFGTASRAYGLPLDANTATTYVFNATSPATYYFAVTAYDSSGSESQPSTEVSKTIE